MDITLQQFEMIADFIYTKSGIKFDLRKHYFISKRVIDRMNALRINTFDDYIRHLRFTDFDKSEFQNLINCVTTNESFFFRDFPQLKTFAENCLTDIVEGKAEAGINKLRIWSAGCSRGEEPYTLAIILCEMFQEIEDWNIEIIATDIDTNALNDAKIGIYEERAIKEIPDEYLEKYFILKRGQYYLSNKIKSMVKFENQNLSEKQAINKMLNFDFIFCRNVLIYFDEVSRKRVVDHFYLSLNRGGYIFLGSSESIGRITNAFVLKRKGNYLVYKKE
jgi:chemotaxis protein methyltransferase CheR